MVFQTGFTLTECECCGCTFVRKAEDREIADIVGSLLLNTDECVLMKEERSVKHHR